MSYSQIDRLVYNTVINDSQLSPIFGYQSQPVVSLEIAIVPIEPFIYSLSNYVKIAKEHCYFPNKHGLTRDQSASVYLYTMEWGDTSFYRIFNAALRTKDRATLKCWFAFLKLFHTALELLPHLKQNVWRGMRSPLGEECKKGDEIVWWSVSSCSLDVYVIKNFLGTHGTLFLIEALNAIDITGYTNYPNEHEVILLPGIHCQVVANSMEHPGGLHIVHLRELPSSTKPPILRKKSWKKSLIFGMVILILIGIVGVTVGLVARKKSSPNGNLSFANSTTDLVTNCSDNSNSKLCLVSTTTVIVPLRAPAIDIPSNAKWIQNGSTVAGGNGYGNGTNQLLFPLGLHVDGNQTIYIADQLNHRIMEWKYGAKSGEVVAGGNGQGNGVNQLNNPSDVIVDKQRDSFIICDRMNTRVVLWPRQNDDSTREVTIMSSVDCMGLTMDENGFFYVLDNRKDEVRRYKMGDTVGRLVAGGNGKGNDLDQLHSPNHVFVDRDHSVYVSDWGNHRVMKWEEGAKEGIVVAGGNGNGSSLTQVSGPHGVVVDQLGTVYVADGENHRIMRWRKGDTHGNVIAGGNGQGGQSNQLCAPYGLSFDRHGNLYVADQLNHRVQKFLIE